MIEVKSGYDHDCPLCRMIDEQEGMKLAIPYDEIIRRGIPLPPVELLSDAEVEKRIDQIIEVLVSLNVCIDSTDHLSDRELYRLLCDETLRQPTETYPESERAVTTISLIGGGAEDDIEIYLTYYADDETRAQWSEDFPDDPMPEKKPKPYDRDLFLPTLETVLTSKGH